MTSVLWPLAGSKPLRPERWPDQRDDGACEQHRDEREPAVARALRGGKLIKRFRHGRGARKALVDEPRQLRDHGGEERPLLAHPPDERLPADLLLPPAFEERLGGDP